jgi:thiol-disulfide isomerase/thioredoxin
MDSMTHRHLSLALLLAAGVAHAQSPDDKPAAAYANDPKYLAAFNEARQYRQDGKAHEARDGFAKANKIAGGGCIPCLNRVYDLDMELKNFKDAVATAAQLTTLAPGPKEKSVAEGRQGDAMLRQAGDKPKPAQLEAVHAVMQAALADHPKNQKALWDDAIVLARMGRTDEAHEAFFTYQARAQPTDAKRIRAARFAENPALATQKMAPAFEVKTLDGSEFNLDDMAGKVVLLDFWATWCGPCNASLPVLQHLAKTFANEPFVILSISQDDDGPKWKQFIAKNNMTWLQYRDRDGRLTRLFDIEGIPHYFTIDTDGALTAEMMGSDSDVEGKIKKLIRRAREAKPALPPGTNSVSGTD